MACALCLINYDLVYTYIFYGLDLPALYVQQITGYQFLSCFELFNDMWNVPNGKTASFVKIRNYLVLVVISLIL